MDAKAGGTELNDANLDNANLTKADFSKSIFNGSSMNGVLDQDTIYDGAKLKGVIR